MLSTRNYIVEALVMLACAAPFFFGGEARGATDTRDSYGFTPLMKLVGKHDATVADLRRLLASGADINARDEAGNTVLMHAAGIRWYSHEMPVTLDVVKYLVEQGADVHARNHQGLNALEVAMCHRECDEEVLAWLRSQGLTASLGAELAMAAGHDDVDGVRRLLAAGANPDFNNAMALWLSLSAGTHGQMNEKENVRLLLAAGADPNLCAADILNCACHGAGMETIGLILSHGVDFSKVDADASSCDLATLWLAREEGWPKPLFMQLVSHGASVNGDGGFWGPFLCCVVADPQQGPRELNYLLSIGADPSIRNKNGKNALDLARELKRTDLIPLLEKALGK